MDAWQELLNSTDLFVQLSTMLLGMIRLVVFISLVPFFGTQVIVTVLFPIALALYFPLHPMLLASSEATISFATLGDVFNILLLVGKEVLIGYFLAFICSCFFYIALCAGTIIDNQRGASMAQGADLLSGTETTPLGSVLFMVVVCLFFSSGAFMNFLAIFYETYNFWPVDRLLPGFLYEGVSFFSLGQVDFLMTHAILVAAPFVVVALLCDVCLGLMNRFAPQLNVFILSMPIKSGTCALLIIFYLSPFMNHQEKLFGILNNTILSLREILGFIYN